MSTRKVGIIAILYNPNEKQLSHFIEFAKYYKVILVDNSDTDVKLDHIGDITYIPLYANKGIATAQNIGLKYAIESGLEIFILFDQDSCAGVQYVKDIVREYEYIEKQDKSIMTLGPLLVDEINGTEYKNCMIKGAQFSKVDAIMSSGSVLTLESIKNVGFMEEGLFIDLVDSEWCWRAISKGYSVYQTRKVSLKHSVGKKYIHIMGIPFYESASVRYYYQYRNMLYLIRRNYVPLNWKYKHGFRKLCELLIIPCIVEYKRNTLSNMLRGIKDGLTNNQ